MEKKNTLLLIVLIFILSLGGCSDNNTVNEAKKDNSITITDCIGREVHVPEKVEKIGCLYAISGHVVTMLGEGEKIVAVNSGLKRDKMLTKICPHILEALEPKVSGSVNIEELVKSDPDVVFISSEMARNKKETKKLEKFGIPYLAIEFKNMEEQQNMINMIGRVIGREKKAERFIKYYDENIRMISQRVKNIPEEKRPRVYHSVNEATRTDTADTLPADWIKLVGVTNVSVDKELRFVDNEYYASLEQILLWNPDVILVNEDGVDQYIRTKDQWKSIKAVKDGRVYLMPNGVSRWGHPNSIEIPLTLLWTAKTFYPDYFGDVDMEKLTKEFYMDFFNYELKDEEIQQILSGKNMRKRKG